MNNFSLLSSAVGIGVCAFTTMAEAEILGLIDFETYAIGTVHNQDGWLSAGSTGSGCAVYDVAVVDNTPYGYADLGSKSLRISNSVTSGCFGDQTFSKSLANEAGETTALNGGLSGGTRHRYFEAEWTFASTVPGLEQPGLSVVASPDRGDGARMSWVQMKDTSSGLEVNFFDVQGTDNPANFVGPTLVASGLARTVPHTIKITMALFDEPSNDVVKVYVDGVLGHMGTSWENYFLYDPESQGEGIGSRTVDSVLFRVGGPAVPATAGYGFLIDNLRLASATTSCDFAIAGTTMTLLSDCTTDATIYVPDGWTLDGNDFTITALDPPGGHFLGAVLRNAGAEAHVVYLTVTAIGLANICDAGDDRLRGIMFDGAGGSIVNNSVIDVNQGPSGCQEGNAIEVRNAPFDNTGTDDKLVLISGNTVSGYIKNGITANGSVAATIANNTVIGNGPVGVPLAAQNGIQVAFGGTATIQDNTVSGHDYTPSSFLACGILYFDADGVRAFRNFVIGNERNFCNIGKGGGQFNPTP